MKTLKIVLILAMALSFISCGDEDLSSKKKSVTKKVMPVNEVGARVYKMCADCHGTDGKNIALGRGRAIAGWEPQRTIDGLKMFTDGTYQGPMAGIMKVKIEELSEEEKQQVAIYISNL